MAKGRGQSLSRKRGLGILDRDPETPATRLSFLSCFCLGRLIR